MFGTLKLRPSTRSGQPYSFELTGGPSGTPHGQQRPVPITRNACVRCRVRKAKCSGEQHGCQRCLGQNIDCFYPPIHPHRLRSASTKSNNKSPTHARSADGDDSASRAAGGHAAMSCSRPFRPDFHLSGEIPGEIEIGAGPPPASEASYLHMDFSLDSIFNMSEGMEGELELDALDSAISVCDSLPDLEPHGLTGTSTTSVSSPTPCSCPLQAVKVLETIEINLVLGLRYHSAGPADVLQCQKRSLARCEALLECLSCMARSEHAMLVLSMCDKIAGSLEFTMMAMDQHGTSSRDRQLGLQIGAWKLDGDDELHAFEGLLTARVEKLRSLLATLSRAVNQYDWTDHQKFVNELQERVESWTVKDTQVFDH